MGEDSDEGIFRGRWWAKSGWCNVSVHEPSDWNAEKEAVRATVAKNCEQWDEMQRKAGPFPFFLRRPRRRFPRIFLPFHSPQVPLQVRVPSTH